MFIGCLKDKELSFTRILFFILIKNLSYEYKQIRVWFFMFEFNSLLKKKTEEELLSLLIVWKI